MTRLPNDWTLIRPPPRDPANSEKKSFRTELRGIWENALTLPKTIKSIVRFSDTLSPVTSLMFPPQFAIQFL